MKYMKLVEGNNVVKFISDVEHVPVHWIKGDDGGMRSNDCTRSEGCMICDSGHRAYDRWSVKVIDYVGYEEKMLFLSPSIFNQLKYIIMDHGDPKDDYDIVIKKVGVGIVKYEVFAEPRPVETPVTMVKALSLSDAYDIGADLDQTIIREMQQAAKPAVVSDDICKSCGSVGEKQGMACVCSNCGKIIWGC